MKILEDVISSLDCNASATDIRQGIFHTAVLTRHCGLASTLPKDALKQQHPHVRDPGFLLEKNPMELAQMAHSEIILEAVIGMATINSLLHVDISRCRDLNAGDLIAERGEGKKIAMVGHFPFVPKLREIAEEVWVIERNPRESDFSEGDAQNLIPKADVVGITGTAFTNHTLHQLLELCHPKAYVVILGDTVPLSPILLDYGIDAVSGALVTDVQRVLVCVSQGANYRQIRGVRRLTLTK